MPKLLNKRSKSVSVSVEGKTLSLSNLDKVYFPEPEITKGELIHYYMETAPLIYLI
ncbi:bifunctional non-homologous end joining protein LigD [Desulfosporosinus lacus DSM 15449]|uniref:Bifunctional non-homologous end joining protein LigD n=1 Tax=Desulfosporosinus lacus DSM 15449 TaxID=1121420 RepID=A0A1M6F1K8_9FIRM|nr:bifunctional non-homologous end joining protein LigD [Desulfosporosinus lacus DSM 15449]